MKRTMNNRVWSICIMMAIGLGGCALNGDIHLYRAEDKKLISPWIIEISGKNTPIPSLSQNIEDTFTIIYDRANFGYIPDFDNSNEVIVAFTFNDDPGQAEEKNIVRILGPMKGITDQGLSSMINKVVYGPRPGLKPYDILRVKIQVFEFDAEEREQRASFLNLVGNIAQTFAISDPVTLAEIKLAKEILGILNQMDQDDVVFEFQFDILPLLTPQNKTRAIPLAEGSYVILKQEKSNEFATYWQWTKRGLEKKDYWCFIFTLPADIIWLPVVAFQHWICDDPDKQSKTEPYYKKDGKKFIIGKDICYIDEYRALMKQKQDDNYEIYRGHTWLSFSIEKGRNSNEWEKRQAISAFEKNILEKIRVTPLTDIKTEELQKAFKEVKTLLDEKKEKLTNTE